MTPSNTRSKSRIALVAAGATLAGTAALTPFGIAAAPASLEGGPNWTGLEGESLLPRARNMPAPRVVGTPAGTMVRSPGWRGAIRLSAGWAYSNGYAHRAWDVAMGLGTPLFAPRSGVVIGTNDGVANNPYGYNPGSGANSNWVLICHTINGKKVSSYWQHMSPGVKVRVGQRVSGPRFDPKTGNLIEGSGTRLGFSGNTGNSTGPHLHLAAFAGCAQPTTSGNNTPAAWSRYNYLNKPSTLVWEPNRLWARPKVRWRQLIVATRTRTDSRWVRVLSRIAGQPTQSPTADGNWRKLVRTQHKALGLKPSPIPRPAFLTAWANATEAFTFRR